MHLLSGQPFKANSSLRCRQVRTHEGVMKNSSNLFSKFIDILAAMSQVQHLFLLLFAAIWLIGCTILFACHYKRMGKPWYWGLKPFAFPFGNFNRKEWLIFVALAVWSLAFGFFALLV